jgi:hypothetical protein
MKAKSKLELAGLDPDGLTGKADSVGTAMTGNVNFPDAAALLAQLAAANITAKAKVIVQKNTMIAAVQATKDRDAALEVVGQALTAVGAHVDSVAKGNPVIIESAGLGVKGAATHIGPLGQVQNLSLTAGDNPGEVDAHWEPMRGKTHYELMRCVGDPSVEANWVLIGSSSGSKKALMGLPSGTSVWVRVRAVAPKPEHNGPWSQPAHKIVP